MQIYIKDVDSWVYEQACAQGYSVPMARVIATRLQKEDIGQRKLSDFLKPSLQNLDAPFLLKDMAKAVERLQQALHEKAYIALETDHDCDGQTSHAVLHEGLVMLGHPKERILSFIGHRLEEGYGLSQALAERIVASSPQPHLVITADNGSSDEARIAWLKEHGIETIVTDHHAIPLSGVPESAVAVLNPQQEGCAYPDKNIAGCMVAWLLIAGLRQRQREEACPFAQRCDVRALLDFVAVGTLADCVSMASSCNNRTVVHFGLHLLARRVRPCWQAWLSRHEGLLTSEAVAFGLAPLLNSDGRLNSALQSVSFLLCASLEEALTWLQHLQEQNQQRKEIQHTLYEKAWPHAQAQLAKGQHAVCIDLAEEGHAGVHGITASRLKEEFGVPVLMLAHKHGETALSSGSVRSIDGVHLKHLLDSMTQETPGLLKAYGGHRAAAGLTVERSKLPLLEEAFLKTCRAHIDQALLGPRIAIDALLNFQEITPAFLQGLQELEPYGRGFETPLFLMKMKGVAMRKMGQTQQHAKLTVVGQSAGIEIVYFFMPESFETLFAHPSGFFAAVSVSLSFFRGQKKISLKIVASFQEESLQRMPIAERIGVA